jgi:phage gpG-like protein
MQQIKIEQLSTFIRQKGRQLDDLMKRRMPVYAGNIAVNHYKENFRKSGYVDAGLRPWTPSKRIGVAKGAEGKYPTLMSKRKHLFSSLTYIPGDYAVIIRNPVEYASIHNEGGIVETHPKVTPKMRKFAWAKYYTALSLRPKESPPETIPEDAARWRRLALTKKTRLDIRFTMPKRQFMGESRELTGKIITKLETEVEKILQ